MKFTGSIHIAVFGRISFFLWLSNIPLRWSQKTRQPLGQTSVRECFESHLGQTSLCPAWGQPAPACSSCVKSRRFQPFYLFQWFSSQSRRACLLGIKSQDWGTQSVVFTVHFPWSFSFHEFSLFLALSPLQRAQVPTLSFLFPSFPIICGSFL